MSNVVREKSFGFAVRIVRLYKFLCAEKKEYVLSKQLLKSGTSIGANIEESLQAQGKRDFLNKTNIALKEATETLYWLRLLHATGYIDEKQTQSISSDCKEITAILVSIVKTTKANLERSSKKETKQIPKE
ncbi:MAG: four helix bundle protein [Clostridiales bacterium]|nr:four helix bundle protein [Clostridiales bacterium]